MQIFHLICVIGVICAICVQLCSLCSAAKEFCPPKMKSYTRLMLTPRHGWFVFALLLFSLVADSQQSRPAPAGTSLTATITAIEGIVQVRQSEDAPWQKATVGMKLGEGAE